MDAELGIPLLSRRGSGSSLDEEPIGTLRGRKVEPLNPKGHDKAVGTYNAATILKTTMTALKWLAIIAAVAALIAFPFGVIPLAASISVIAAGGVATAWEVRACYRAYKEGKRIDRHRENLVTWSIHGFRNLLPQERVDQLFSAARADLSEGMFEFREKVRKLKELIYCKKAPKDWHDHLEKEIIPLVHEISRSDVYAILQDEIQAPLTYSADGIPQGIDPFLWFVQAFMAHRYAGSPSKKAYEEFGKQELEHVRLPLEEEEVSLEIFADHLAATVRDSSMPRRDGATKFKKALATAGWAFDHSKQAQLSMKGHANEGYNGCEIGNSYNATTDVYGLRAYAGPTIGDGEPFGVYLDWLGNHGSFCIRHDLQYSGSVGEDDRISAQEQLAKDSKGRLKVFRTPFDGPAYALKSKKKGVETPFSALLDCQDVRTFLNEYHRLITQGDRHRTRLADLVKTGLDDRGYYLPEELISDEELQTVFNETAQFFQNLELASDKKERRAQLQMVIFALQGFITTKILSKQEIPAIDPRNPFADCVIPSFGQACKQDVDRGVMHNIFIYIGSRMRTGSLTRSDLHFAAGLINRALLVDGRKTQDNRFQPLYDWLMWLHKQIEH